MKCPFLSSNPPLLLLKTTVHGDEISEVIGDCLEGECALWVSDLRYRKDSGGIRVETDEGHCSLRR